MCPPDPWKPDPLVESPKTAEAAAAAADGPAYSNATAEGTPLHVPGLHGVPVFAPLPGRGGIVIGFRHAALDLAAMCVDRVLAREVAMLRVMNNITDRPGWQLDVDDKAFWSLWKREEREPLMSEEAWRWCQAELTEKANVFDEVKGTYVLEAGSRVFKSDTVVSKALQDDIAAAVKRVMDEYGVRNLCKTDEKTKKAELVTHIVDPSLYPLIYGRTPVLMKGGCVSLEGSFAPPHVMPGVSPRVERAIDDGWKNDGFIWRGRRAVYRHGTRFSDEFQWLPCEVSFVGDPNSTDVRITSCINNLHPVKHKALYEAIENIIGLSIEPWNCVLMPRELTSKKRIERGEGAIVNHENQPSWWTDLLQGNTDSPKHRALLQKARRYIGSWRRVRPETFRHTSNTIKDERLKEIAQEKWEAQHAIHPPVNVDLYPEWWTHHNPNNTPLRLQSEFRDLGLQVIVQLTSIDLNKDNPRYNGSPWSFAGTLNDKIVACTTYCLSTSNITPSRITFRQRTPELKDTTTAEEQILGADFPTAGNNFDDMFLTWHRLHTQETGSVLLQPGRMVSYSNSMQARDEAFEIIHPFRPGHRRCLTVYLVDPMSRLCSTRNVPAQRRDWREEWTAEVRSDLLGVLPLELVDMIFGYINDEGLMDGDEAWNIRKKVQDAHNGAQNAVMEELHWPIFG
ncbi:uncharacterized protein E0L32_000900 [Thyridium curvatum]|uniref:Uncharacterized protein n=1 Tax=Thyridium curvatum TaxID=1093900 RepID=A0A507AYL7_9PEZI|nr:uncharacterized protein E0L32_000900 [Thyridium curvatum]TPX12723.1 hypothetical protein E0L32_000900 [Thyridium curvatum]